MSSAGTYHYPPTVPKWKTLRNVFRLVKNPIPVISENMRQYGPTYSFKIGGMRECIVSSEPDFIQHVLQRNHRNYRKSDLQGGILKSYMGLCLLTSAGDHWVKHRKMIQPGFHKERLSTIMDEMNQEINAFCKTLAASLNGPVDIYRQMNWLSFRIITKALFSSEYGERDMRELSGIITEVQEMILKQIRQPHMAFWHHFSGQLKHHHALAEKSKELLLEKVKVRMASEEVKDDLLAMLLEARYEDTMEPMSLPNLISECLGIFVAGHETTANALAWTFYLLAQHPDVLAKLHQEWDEVIGDRDPVFEDIRKLRYTTMVIEESMRVYPPAWVIDRFSNEDDEVLGYRFPKNTFIILYIYGLHHDQTLWPHPADFDPERFAPEKAKQRHPFSYIPFGAGPRRCIGGHFAALEMQLAMIAFLRNFKFELTDDPVNMKTLITLRPETGIKFNLTPTGRFADTGQPVATL